jgi:hypothetical protein
MDSKLTGVSEERGLKGKFKVGRRVLKESIS